MSKTSEYRQTLRELDDWIPFLRKESGLPGPRGNLELAYAVAAEGTKSQFEQLLAFQAEENTSEVFLVFCGLIGLGRVAANEPELFERLCEYASDSRWRIRESVATGLQLAGDQNMDLLLKEMQVWSKGSWHEKRAAAAALSEPRLLKNPGQAKKVLQVLHEITKSMEKARNPTDESFKILRQAMGYCWSVAVAATPEVGKPMMEKWLSSQNKDIQWLMRENLKKHRLIRMDPAWVEACKNNLNRAARASFIPKGGRAVSASDDFSIVFERLRNILKPYARELPLKTDTPDTYYLGGPYSARWQKELFFGSAQIKKNYVSFYLMPVYMYPELLKDISPELRKRMQGKSCFNFKKVEAALFDELAVLTRKGAQKFKEESAK